MIKNNLNSVISFMKLSTKVSSFLKRTTGEEGLWGKNIVVLGSTHICRKSFLLLLLFPIKDLLTVSELLRI